jgi:ABC-type branched-subunit amino acid transport system substrate-binding protein
MWAAIAVSLWTGDLKPESQADVKRAMQAWFDDQEIDVGNTPVVERARALWRKMEASR